MAEGFFKALGDPAFWKGVQGEASDKWDQLGQKWDAIASAPSRADAIAEERFPDSARDASVKNAFRHALGTGMLAQELGGGKVGSFLAQEAGRGWEMLGAKDYLTDADHREDTHHDLNANTVGARMASQVGSQQELIRALEGLARQSTVQDPGAGNRRTMTRSVR